MKNFMDALPPYLLAFAAVVCFCLIIYFCFRNELKAATLLSGLFFLCVLLAYFPQLESVKAFTVDVKLRKSLDRAEDILTQVKELTAINAKTSYMVLAWQNRMGAPSAKSKQAMLDEIDQTLTGLKIGESERNEIVRPYVQMIGVDLFFVFSAVIDKYVVWKREHITAEGSAEINARREAFAANERDWRQLNSNGIGSNIDNYDLDFYLRREIPSSLFDSKEIELANNFRVKILDLYSSSKAKGGLTPEAAELLDQANPEKDGAQKMMIELFDIK